MSNSESSQVSSEATAKRAIVETGYDAIAPKYFAWSSPRPTTTRAEYVSKLISILPAKARVLELGCGAGVPTTQALIKAGLDVTGVDISAAQINLAREHIPEATLIHADMMKLEFEDNTFDAVMAFYSLFHIPREEQGTMIRRITNWLKPGGWFLANLGTGEGDTWIDDWMGARMFSSGLGIDGNRAMLKTDGEGLRIVEDEVAIEKVGGFDETFHWVFATKKDE
jgi:ubiquinone/menaquinone biosynthesis C-methylase UbiE